jgi:hypothetical protein
MEEQLLQRIIFLTAVLLAVAMMAPASDAAPVHTTYLWHMHQPIYWPAPGTWNPCRYETAYETITLGHSQNDVFDIFNKDDRVSDYQHYPRDAVASILDIPDAGAQVSFAASLIENISSLSDAGWNGGRYAPDWYSAYRTARSWTTSGGRPRLEQILVAAHHPIAPLMDENALRREIEVAKAAYGAAWGGAYSKGYFPAEMCFSERMIPVLAAAGVEWIVIADIHVSRACADYPYSAGLDNCDPPNAADQVNPAQGYYQSITISRGVTVKTPVPYGYRPHYARFVDPDTGEADSVIVVPAANAMSWNEGYGLYDTDEIDAVASHNDPARPMLILFAHDGDNAWSGGYSYYNENVTSFSHAAVSRGYEPSTVDEYLADHPVDPADVIHVEDGGWVNADGDFGSPQFINWNWPLVDASGNFDIPGGWAEDERNWAVLTAAQNRVETAEAVSGTSPDPAAVFSPASGSTPVEKAWHHLLSGYESGYMYYGASLDMEIKATLACNAAVSYADPLSEGQPDETAPTVWLPQRLPWNPGGYGGGSLWGYPGGDGAPMPSDFHVWTFAYDVSGLERVEFKYRIDADGTNPMANDQNETFAGGPEVGSWQTLSMTRRAFPKDDFLDSPEIDFTVLPDYIADEFWVLVEGLSEVFIDYYVEAQDSVGNIKRSPIQHVYVGAETADPPHVMDGSLDGDAVLVASAGGLDLYADWDGEYLYLATQGVGSTSFGDHFVIVGTDLSGSLSAPWAKSGTVASRTLFLGNEDGNNWCGWFDQSEALIAIDAECASGVWLEGAIHLESLVGSPLPDGLYLCAVAYGTDDLGPLITQAPAEVTSDGDISADEYAWFPLSTTGSGDLGPTSISMSPARPNPFSGSTTVDLFLPRSSPVSLEIYDVAGRRVRMLVSGSLGPGRHTIIWDGINSAGVEVSPGIYFARLISGKHHLTGKVVVLK